MKNKICEYCNKEFFVILYENNITTLEEALKCKELWDTDNGRTLCIDCHHKTDTWGQKTRKIVLELIKNNKKLKVQEGMVI